MREKVTWTVQVNWDSVSQRHVRELQSKSCLFSSSLCAIPQSNVLFCFSLFSVWVNEKVWELVTYCAGALLDCVYILNYY